MARHSDRAVDIEEASGGDERGERDVCVVGAGDEFLLGEFTRTECAEEEVCGGGVEFAGGIRRGMWAGAWERVWGDGEDCRLGLFCQVMEDVLSGLALGIRLASWVMEEREWVKHEECAGRKGAAQARLGDGVPEDAETGVTDLGKDRSCQNRCRHEEELRPAFNVDGIEAIQKLEGATGLLVAGDQIKAGDEAAVSGYR